MQVGRYFLGSVGKPVAALFCRLHINSNMSPGVMEFTTKLSEVSCDNPIPKSFTCIHCAFTNINGKISLFPVSRFS